jgi:hypothetical protein
VLCEDTRRTRVLLDRYEIRARRLVSVHGHNEARRVTELLPLLEAGETHALVSDAGLPGVNDPGSRLVEAALDAGVEVTVLPGPSAVETALVVSGSSGAVPLPRVLLPRRGARRTLARRAHGRMRRSRSSAPDASRSLARRPIEPTGASPCVASSRSTRGRARTAPELVERFGAGPVKGAAPSSSRLLHGRLSLTAAAAVESFSRWRDVQAAVDVASPPRPEERALPRVAERPVVA